MAAGNARQQHARQTNAPAAYEATFLFAVTKAFLATCRCAIATSATNATIKNSAPRRRALQAVAGAAAAASGDPWLLILTAATKCDTYAHKAFVAGARAVAVTCHCHYRHGRRAPS